MYPDSSNEEIGEIIAAFFNSISQEYVPNPDPSQTGEGQVFVQPLEISAKLKTFKKPKGLVKGDISPILVNHFHDILAIPLAIIYNQVLNTLS